MGARTARPAPEDPLGGDRKLRSLLAEYERMSEAWRQQLQTTLHGFDELEAQRRTVLAGAVQTSTVGASPGNATNDRPLPTLPVLLAAYERNVVQWALANTKGNQKDAAARLGIRPTTLHEKMKRLGLLHPEHGAPDESEANLATRRRTSPHRDDGH